MKQKTAEPALSWKQIRINAQQHQIEILEEALLSLGALSITCLDAGDQPLLEPAPGETPLWDDCTLLALFAQDFSSDNLRNTLSQLTGEKINGDITTEIVEDEDWERAWLENFKPMFFGNKLWICPLAIDPPDPSAINLRLDPGLAFGTGTHPTTALCLQWLDAHAPQGLSVLDFGCGSGILAIAALLLGAKHATATDIDSQALQASKSNAANNQVSDRLTLLEPSQLGPEKVDMLLANILSGTLIDLSDELVSRVKPNGAIVLSGILDHQAQDVTKHYTQWFDMSPPIQKEEWICLVGRKR